MLGWRQCKGRHCRGAPGGTEGTGKLFCSHSLTKNHSRPNPVQVLCSMDGQASQTQTDSNLPAHFPHKLLLKKVLRSTLFSLYFKYRKVENEHWREHSASSGGQGQMTTLRLLPWMPLKCSGYRSLINTPCPTERGWSHQLGLSSASHSCTRPFRTV